MSSAPKHAKDWEPTKLQALIDAKSLAIHTREIVKNDKVFDPKNDFQNDLRYELIHTARDIFTTGWSANRISTRAEEVTRESFEERLRGQAKAIRLCDDLLALIEIAWKQFHIDTRKIKHWGKMIINVEKELSAWHRSDTDRYKQLFK